jgi:hypothetical protein
MDKRERSRGWSRPLLRLVLVVFATATMQIAGFTGGLVHAKARNS